MPLPSTATTQQQRQVNSPASCRVLIHGKSQPLITSSQPQPCSQIMLLNRVATQHIKMGPLRELPTMSTVPSTCTAPRPPRPSDAAVRNYPVTPQAVQEGMLSYCTCHIMQAVTYQKSTIYNLFKHVNCSAKLVLC